MAETSAGGRWAAEAFDFLRLHQRIRGRFFGLVFWQICWIGILWGATRVLPAAAADRFELPWLHLSCLWSAASCVSWTPWPIGQIYVLGALGTLALWLITSGLSLIVWRPIADFVRGLLAWIVLIVGHAVISAWFTVAMRLSRRAAPQAAMLPSVGEEPAPAGASTESGKTVQEEQKEAAAEAERAREERVNMAMLENIRPVVDALAPPIRIGVAPIEAISFEDEQVAARLPLQLFTDAHARVRELCAQSAPLSRARLELLPLAWRVTNPQSARFLRHWLGYDVVMWGTLAPGADPALVMNFEDGRLADTSNPRIERSWGPLFVGTVALPSSMLVRTDSPVDARIALLLALLHAVEGRASRRGLNFQRPIDTVRYGADDVSARLSDVILAMLHVHEEEIIWTADPPTSGNVLVQIAQRWVTERLEDKPGSKTFDPDQFSLEALAQVVNTALQLSDGPSDLHYLAGVLALTGKKANPAKAAALVESGWKIDRMTRFRGSVYLAQVVAQHLETASGESELAREAATAKAALYGDLTMRLDAEEAPRWLLECIKESKIHKDLSILRMALDKKWDTGLEDLFRRSISPGIEHLWRLVGLEAQLSLPCAPTSNPPAEQAPTVTAAVGSASR